MTSLTARQPHRARKAAWSFEDRPLIDYFAIGLTHALLALAVLRLLSRTDLDSDGTTAPKVTKPWLKGRKQDSKQDPEQAGADA